MDAKNLRQQIYDAGLPLLQGRVVTDLVIGLSLLAVELTGMWPCPMCFGTVSPEAAPFSPMHRAAWECRLRKQPGGL